ncbi:MAG: AarF/ABC1/UbiB kinase family protein [candidate division KSB1 bacterium]|nr:AarF/ABC1/UbiB kinase family protein [candidate division KSB1 bacterium]
MPLLLPHRRYRHLRRYRQIATVLIKYGFAEVLGRMHLLARLRLAHIGPVRRYVEGMTAPQRLRAALEELGPTFIKFGQILSTRSLILPADFVEELAKLQDRATPLPFAELEPVLRAALGRSVDECFAYFDPDPLATASIAQAHRAQLHDGREVVVKIQRPGIQSIIEEDIEILEDLARLAARHLAEARRFSPETLVAEFARALRRELDFLNEARNAEIFRRNFARVPTVYIPQVLWEYTRPQVLTVEYVDGIKISDVASLQQAGIEPRWVVEAGAHFVLKQIFEDGFFHADPHPGNLFVTRDRRIVPIDFGIVGRLDETTMTVLADLTVAVYKRDVSTVVNLLIDLGALDESSDLPALRFDLAELIDRYYGVSLQHLDVRTLIREGLEVMNRYDIRLPPNLGLLMKTLGTYEDVTRNLVPDFNFAAEMPPYIRKLIRYRLRPHRVAYEMARTLRDAYHLLQSLPREVELLFRRLKRGHVRLQMEHRGLDNLVIELDRASNRLSFALIIAAIIVGSSLIMQLNRPPFLLGYPLLGVVGYLFAGVLGVWLVIAILRSGRL